MVFAPEDPSAVPMSLRMRRVLNSIKKMRQWTASSFSFGPG